MKKKFLLLFAMLYSLCSNAQPVNGLVAYWPMNGNFNDNGPNGIAVTNYGATATTNNNGNANAAMNFVNVSGPVTQFARHNPNANLNFTAAQDFSVDFSLYIPSPFNHPAGLYDNNLNYGGYGIWIWSANGYLQVNMNYKNGNIGSTNGAITTNTWFHVCCLREAGVMKIYINGILNASGPEGSLNPVYSYPARFGTMFYSAYTPPEYNGHTGKLDECRIYNRALTQAEIISLVNPGVLPVKLNAFVAVNKNGSILLHWQTQLELNSSHFILQRSVDGTGFEDIANIAASGNSTNALEYLYNDILPPGIQLQKTVFYRLKMVDIDGKFIFSQVIAIHPDKKELELNISPNPARDMVQLQTGNMPGGKAQLEIIDATGSNIYKKNMLLHQGINSFTINITRFSSGTYTIRLHNASVSETKQFVKN
jgi:hypothetical protein